MHIDLPTARLPVERSRVLPFVRICKGEEQSAAGEVRSAMVVESAVAEA